MTRLAIIHPDSAVCQALAQTIQLAWPDAVITGDKEADLFLAVSTQGLPADQTVLIGEAPLRLKQILQKLQKAQQAKNTRVCFGDHQLDLLTREFTGPKTSCELTEKESALIQYLFQRQQPATRDDLLRDVWNYASDVDTHTIETHIYRLRQKIEPDAEKPSVLITVKDGYQLAAFSKA